MEFYALFKSFYNLSYHIMHHILGTDQLMAVEAAFTNHFFTILFQNTGSKKKNNKKTR